MALSQVVDPGLKYRTTRIFTSVTLGIWQDNLRPIYFVQLSQGTTKVVLEVENICLGFRCL